MQCVCCLDRSGNGKSFKLFSASDRKLYFELTKLELNHKTKLKICEDCKKLLRSSTGFFKLCIKSYEELYAVAAEEVKVKLKRRSRRKVDEFVEEQIQDCHLNDDEDSEDDEEPISNLIKQLKKKDKEEKSTGSTVLESSISPQETAQLETPCETQNLTQNILSDSKKKIKKFLCTECGTSFSTSQRLQVHGFTHSGIKNWKCDDCDKVFATKFRLRAHTSKLTSF